MPVQIELPDESLTHLNQQAQEECRRAVDRYAQDLLREAGRLEATGRTAAGNPEITSSMVKDADLLMRRGYARRPKGVVMTIAQVMAPVSGAITGLLADMQKLRDPGTLILFVFLLAFTITTTAVVVLKD
jgi:hypothetical protein